MTAVVEVVLKVGIRRKTVATVAVRKKAAGAVVLVDIRKMVVV